MKLNVIPFPADNYLHTIPEQIIEDNLLCLASEVAEEMEFESDGELENALKRSMELCITAGLPVKMNFKRIFKSYPDGIHVDWKISILAYYLLKLNGDPANRSVAQMQIHLLKDHYAFFNPFNSK